MKNTNLLYQADAFPVFQNRMYNSKEAALDCPRGNIRIVQDLKTGLISNSAFRPELMTYDEDYENEQAVSEIFQKHLEYIFKIISSCLGTSNIVEVGCGKGHFLEILVAKGFNITGFDPTYAGTNQRIKKEYFGPASFEKANSLILRHVLEHIQNPIDFLEKLKLANNGSGKIYIEVPCFDWICNHKAWFDIFYEHVNYFRLSDFNRIFGEVIKSGYCFGGQYLYVVAELGSLKTPVINNFEDRVNFPSDFTDTIQNRTEQNRTEQNRTAIWGGASKGVIFALLKTRAGQSINNLIDINPAKQGKFIAGTGLEIKSPEQGLLELEEGDTIFVMNSNYLEEIKAMTNNNYHYVSIDST
jgi:SAM-dependent methyltransferase